MAYNESTDRISNSLWFSTPFEYPDSEHAPEESGQTAHALFELISFLDGLPHAGIGISCLKLCLGKEERSERQIANRFGVTKAAVSKTLQIVRDRFQLKPRCGRSEKARKVFTVKRLKAKRKRNKWQRLKLFRR